MGITSDRFLKRLKRAAARGGVYRTLARLRERLAPRSTLDLKRLLSTGELPLPTSFTFEPTLKCNLRCTMCYQNDYRDKGVKPELGLEEIRRIFRGSGRHFRRSYLVGGEVFLRRDFEDLLELLEAERIQVFLTSNGTVLPLERLAALRRFSNLTGMWFSLDGVGEVHDRIRGPKSFEQTVRSLREAKGRFEVGSSFVIMPDNVHQMLDFARLVASLGIVEVNYQHEIYATNEEFETSRQWLGWRPDELMVYVRPTGQPPGFRQTLEANLQALPALERELKVVTSFEPPVANQRLDDFYAGTLRDKARLFCRQIDDLRIDPQGNVIFCPYLRKSFGNLLDQPVEVIWNSPELRRFRVDLLGSNLLPICQRCCKLGLWPGTQQEKTDSSQLPTAALS
jgi:MoaA/NifB/PqqE/SkfB family radical SAM enzyme